MTSQDVLHSVFVPAFRVKQDVVPGRYTSLWFEANKMGSFQLFCTEFCCDQYSAMLVKVNVVSKEAYEEWLRTDPYKGLSMLEIGQQVYQGRCLACHNTDEQAKIAPGFGNLFGKTRQFVDGGQVVADENYIRGS